METLLVEKKFKEIGARVKFGEPRQFQNNLSIDIRKDKEGEFFDIKLKKEIELMVLDVQKNDRHLLMMAVDNKQKSKFLCGHDERNWFTCAIPEKKPVSTVIGAKQALKPDTLVKFEKHEGIKTKDAHKRHRRLKTGKKIHRQGEFMFIPEPNFNPPNGSLTIIHKNEPMRRGSGNSHYAEELYRKGGNVVYISNFSDKTREGISKNQYQKLLTSNPETSKLRWRTMVANPIVYARGKITHKEHKTLDLGTMWHKVVLNTENEARASKDVKFLD